MSDTQIIAYLSAALDQEACRDTLRSALISRYESLRQRGISHAVLVDNLKRMCADVYQINDDVIREIIVWASEDGQGVS